MTEDRVHKLFLLALVVAITIAFVTMLRSFLTTILMAAVFSGLAYPAYARLLVRLKGRRALASAATLLLTVVLVIGPLLAIVGVVVAQAVRVTGAIGREVQRFINEPTYFGEQFQRIPGIDRLEPYRDQILISAGEVISWVGSFLVGSLSDTTRGTVAVIFQFFILLYTMFFFLMDGPAMLRTVLNHLPLRRADKEQLVDRFVSVTRATVKGTIIVGLLQGGLSGLAFAAVGIPDALFWGVVMVVLSILPLVGGALVWAPASITMVATGEALKGVLLALFCSLIVGSVDNLLRPRLVGRDTKMHDLLILFSTLGGILAFGLVGFIIGPILAGLFVTTWEIFAVSFRDVLRDDAPQVVEATAFTPTSTEDSGGPAEG